MKTVVVVLVVCTVLSLLLFVKCLLDLMSKAIYPPVRIKRKRVMFTGIASLLLLILTYLIWI